MHIPPQQLSQVHTTPHQRHQLMQQVLPPPHQQLYVHSPPQLRHQHMQQLQLPSTHQQRQMRTLPPQQRQQYLQQKHSSPQLQQRVPVPPQQRQATSTPTRSPTTTPTQPSAHLHTTTTSDTLSTPTPTIPQTITTTPSSTRLPRSTTKPRPTTITANNHNYRTRSKTAHGRTAHTAAKIKKPALKPKVQAKARRRRQTPSYQPKRVCIKKSQIPGAGLGLYLLEDAKAGDFIARYSGEPLSRQESVKRRSHYRLQVHKNLYLDAADPRHFEGRYINDSKGSAFKTNARFASCYRTNICSATGYSWVRVYATRKIRAGEEVFLDYGKDFWLELVTPRTTPVLQPPSTPPPPFG